MSQLEDLKPNAAVGGILPNSLVTVVSVGWLGTEALELTYRDPSGKLGERLLFRADENTFEIVEQGRTQYLDHGRRSRVAGQTRRFTGSARVRGSCTQDFTAWFSDWSRG